jgi:hypothetical protein
VFSLFDLKKYFDMKYFHKSIEVRFIFEIYIYIYIYIYLFYMYIEEEGKRGRRI